MKRRSDEDILQFMRELPGGNVPQYAKLLNTTRFASTPCSIRPRARSSSVRASSSSPRRASAPAGGLQTTARGSLRARDVDDDGEDNTLPPFISKLLEQVHPTYRDDTLNFLREALEQTRTIARSKSR
jgi:hypothetical protein